MAKFWNFVLFQLGWFACVLGAANRQVFWAVAGTIVYIVLHAWYSPSPKAEAKFLLKTLIFGVIADTLIVNLGFLIFHDPWPFPYLSPLWMWVLWVLVGTTINSSLSWLRGRPILGAFLGGVCGPMSYEAGIRMGAGTWGASGLTGGFILVGVAWAIAIPLFFYWDKSATNSALLKNQ
jgi:hypothetical protein